MAVHTFQLIYPTLTHNKFNQCRSHVFHMVNSGLCSIFYRKNDDLGFYINYLKGTRWMLIKSNIPHLSITINPSILLGGGYADLCNITLDTFESLATYLNEILEMLCNITLSELALHRIDCTVDVQLSEDEAMEEFISCIKNTRPLYRYHIDDFKSSFCDYKEKNRHSFRMACNDVSLTVYDKSYQLRKEKLMNIGDIPPNRLRFEAAFENGAFQRLFYRYHQCVETDYLNQKVIWFSNMSVSLLRDYFERTLVPGQYLKLHPALDIINQSNYTPKTKDRMKDFLREVSRCHRIGIAGAEEEFRARGYSKKRIQGILNKFSQYIGIAKQ